MPGDRSGVARRTSDEASHRVPDEIQLINRHRPGLEKSIEELRQLEAVLADAEPAVVANVDRRDPEVALELG
jgi:hypothetical protein